MSNRLDQEREARLEPKRVENTIKKLIDMGFRIEIGNSVKFYDIVLSKDDKVRFYPYSGWYTSKLFLDGRGFENLLDELKKLIDDGRLKKVKVTNTSKEQKK